MIGQILGGGLALAQGLAGTGSKQQQDQKSFTKFRPEDMAAIQAARGGVTSGTQNLLQQLQQSQADIRSGFQTPTTGFAFSQTPDAYTRAMASFINQGMGQQAAAQRQDLAQKFRGPVGQILGRQAEMQTRLQQNPSLFNVFQQQQGRELAQAQMQAAQTEASNRALIGREQALTGLGTTGLSAQGNLLAQELGLGQAFGEQITQALARGRSGGLFSDK